MTGYWVSPINSTYAGTLTPSTGPTDQASVQISENTSLQVNISGTVSGNGVVTTVTAPGPGVAPINFMGALLTAISHNLEEEE